jgi:hypothetical protein
MSSMRMDTLKAERAEFDSLKDLKPMLGAQGPCLSAYMQLSTAPNHQGAKANSLQWRELLKSVEPKIEQSGAAGRELLESVSDWEALSQGDEPQGKSVAVFRSQDLFRLAWIEGEVSSRAVVGPHFYVRPLLPELMREKTFYILALSQKNVRLLRCTSRTSEEVPLPGVDTNFEKYMNSVKPDHVSQRGGATGQGGGGGTRGMTTGTTAVRENADNRDEYLAHFFKQVDHGLNECLRGKTEPVVLAAVEYELALYRPLSKYPHLAQEAVEGAPNSLKSGEMHARAIEAMARCYDHKLDEQLAQYNHKAGGGASNRMKDIVLAAHDGRVLTLLVSDSSEQTGAFDEATHTVKGRESGGSEDEDLVNDAVVQTILHAGQVFVVPNSKMPNGTPVAAIYRF